MASQNDISFETWTAPATEAFKFWISFFPTAPLFGVEWRYGEMVSGAAEKTTAPATAKAKAPAPVKTKTPAKPKAAAKTSAPKAEAAKPAKKAVAETGVEKTAETAAVKAVEAPVKDVAVAPAPKAEPVSVVEPATKAKAPTKAAKVKSVDAKPVEAKTTEAKATDAKPADAKPVAAPKAAAPAEAKPVDPSSAPDDLKLIKGVGPGLERQLNGLGIYQFAQIAEMTETDLKSIDDRLTSFKGRCFRDDWVGQAKALLG